MKQGPAKKPRTSEPNVANDSSSSSSSSSDSPVAISAIVPLKAPTTIEFQRRFDHVNGNWPTFIYIPTCSSTSVQRLLSHCTDQFLHNHKLSEESICREATPHISLSRTLTLRFHQIDAFVATLGRSLQACIR